jgi:Na+-driven multidrug efflux pump
LLSSVYGVQFAHLRSTSVLIGIAYIIMAWNVGTILVFKTTRNTRHLFHVQVITLVASLGSVAPLTLYYGVDGAAWATIVMGGFSVSGFYWYQRRIRRLAGSGLTRISSPATALYPPSQLISI